MHSQYTWIPFFEELGEAIGAYKNRQAELVKLLSDVGISVGLMDRSMKNGPNDILLEEIDPFTFFAIVLKYSNFEKRRALMSLLKDKLDLASNLPDDFDGVPNCEPRYTWYFPYKYERLKDDVPTLWQVYEEARSAAGVQSATLVRACNILYCKAPKLSQGLFWMFPRKYLPFDKKTNQAIHQQHPGLSLEEFPRDYLEVLEQTKSLVAENRTAYAELSHSGHRMSIESAEQELANNSASKQGSNSRSDGREFITLRELFRTADDAKVHFSRIARCLELSGIEDLDSPVVALTYRRYGSMRRLRLNIYNAGIYLVEGRDGTMSSLRVASTPIDSPEVAKRRVFNYGGDVPVGLYRIAPSDYDKYATEIHNGVSAIGRLYARYKKSPVSSYHRAEIMRAIKDPSLIESILDIPFEEFKGQNQAEMDTLDVSDTQRQVSLNTILYGPPGTGKTYRSIEVAVEIIDGPNENSHEMRKKRFDELRALGQVEFITFHQNYSYEDFVTGIIPDTSANQLLFQRRDGVFKHIADRALRNYLAATNHSSSEPSFEEVFQSFFKDLFESDTPVEISMSRAKYTITAIDENGSISFTKQSGGHSHVLLSRNVKDIYNRQLEYSSVGLGIYYYPLVDQLRAHAVQLSQKPLPNEDDYTLKNYVLVIDEINRANISKVFGELITLLEDDKRVGAENELRVRLPNGESNFGVPPNLYIVGTMNTADRSIALIDIALRRRFEFIGQYPNLTKLAPESQDLLRALNAAIYEKRNSADYLVGHAFFMKEMRIEEVLLNKIIPLLMEYFSGKHSIVSELFNSTKYKVYFNTESFSWVVEHK